MSVSGVYRLVKMLFFWLPLLAGIFIAAFAYVCKLLGVTSPFVLHYWAMLSHFKRNAVIGVCIAVVLHLGHSSSWVKETEDWAMDFMNLMQVNTEYLSETETNSLYTFIDIDELSYVNWGEPYHTPRDKLLQLIQYSVQGGAKAIFVDIDLTRAGTDPIADRALELYLSDYPDDAPDLVLLRTFSTFKQGNNTLNTLRKPYFDNDDKKRSRIHWAHPRFSQDNSDRRIRRWRLVEAGCLDNKIVLLPSPQLTLTLQATNDQSWEKIEALLSESLELPKDCSEELNWDNQAGVKLKVGEHFIEIAAQGKQQRVLYSFSDADDMKTGRSRLGYQRISASTITDAKQAVASVVADRTVIIGVSYAASRDYYATPVGEMPGALIILNAVKSLKQFGQMSDPQTWAKVLIELILIALMAYVFSQFDSIFALLITGLVVVVVLVPISFYFFRYGVWVDLAVPILGMQLHQVIAKYEEVITMKNKLRQFEKNKAGERK